MIVRTIRFAISSYLVAGIPCQSQFLKFLWKVWVSHLLQYWSFARRIIPNRCHVKIWNQFRFLQERLVVHLVADGNRQEGREEGQSWVSVDLWSLGGCSLIFLFRMVIDRLSLDIRRSTLAWISQLSALSRCGEWKEWSLISLQTRRQGVQKREERAHEGQEKVLIRLRYQDDYRLITVSKCYWFLAVSIWRV